MSTSHAPIFDACRCAAFVLAALATGAVIAQDAKLDANCSAQMSHLQQRLYQKADEGSDVLRNFLYIRRAILQLDIYETGVWADSVRQARAVCMKKLVQARRIPHASTPLDETDTMSRIDDAAARPRRDESD